jgi:hypothetical protein
MLYLWLGARRPMAGNSTASLALNMCSTSGQNRYTTQNMYNVLKGDDDTNKDTVTTITQTVAAATNTGTTPHVRLAVNVDITAAITQLAAN